MDERRRKTESTERRTMPLARRTVLLSGAAVVAGATLKGRLRPESAAVERRPLATLVLAAALVENPPEAAYRTRVEGFGPAGVEAVQSLFQSTGRTSAGGEPVTTLKRPSAGATLALYVVDLDDATARRLVLAAAESTSRRNTPALCLGASASGAAGFGAELSCPFFTLRPSASAGSRRLSSPGQSVTGAGLAQGLSALVESMFVPGLAVSAEDVMGLFGPAETRGHFASAVAEGHHRAVGAARMLVQCFSGEARLAQATKLLLSLNCPRDMTLEEVNHALTVLHDEVHPEADILFGSLVDDDARSLTITALVAGPCQPSGIEPAA